MFVFLPGAKLHFGGEVVNGVLGKSFVRPSNTAGDTKTYAGPGVTRGERSTGELATFVVEEEVRGGPKKRSFTQGQYETTPVATTGLKPVRVLKELSWPTGCRKAEYALSLYDPLSNVDPSPSLTTIEHSSAYTGLGVAVKLTNTSLW
jgi:hypothetical protein